MRSLEVIFGHFGSFWRSPLKAVAVACLISIGAAAAAKADGAEAATYAGIVVDGKSGKVLYQADPDGLRYPASLTKMMTLYLLFEALDTGKVTYSTPFEVSANAAAQPPSKLGVKAGDSIPVKDAILSLVTLSANDVAVVIAENLAGSESSFANRMTATARSIGMSRTTFRNASGLPNPGQMTTARDMATLGRALRDRFPNYYPLFATRSFTYRGRLIRGHNRLFGRIPGVDGIKTGYTRASGYNLVTSVKDDKRYVVGVVLGGRSGASRDTQMANLLTEYIPKASTGARTTPLIVASAVPSLGRSNPPASIADPVLVTPRPKPEDEIRTTASIAAIVADGDTAEGDADDEDKEVAAPAAPKAPAVSTGWKIQIGALPSEDQANDMIAKAKAAAPTVLAKVTPFTETVEKGSSTFYRARFGGFADKEAARDACSSLAKKKISCLAIQ